MTVGFWLRQLVRETRGARGRLLFFAVCLAVGVAAVVAVAALADSLDRSVRREAKSLLGGDVAVSGGQPIPERVLDLPALAGADRVRIAELATMAGTIPDGGAPPRSQLVELKAVDGPYPMYGAVETEPAPLDELLAEGAVVAPELLRRLGVGVGDPLRIGDLVVPVAGTVTREPDRVVSPFALGPRVLVSRDAFDRTGLATFGSRIDHRVLWRLPGNATRDEAAALGAAVGAALADSRYHRVETWAEAQPSLRQGLDRVERFLGLLALLSLLVGGVGVAGSIRAWIQGRLDAIAVLACLGVRPREAFLLHLVQALLLGFVGSLLGGFAGLALQFQVPVLLGELVPAGAVTFWQPAALARGFALGLPASALFALPSLIAVARVPPLRALRRDAEPLPTPRWIRIALPALLAAGLFALAAVQAKSTLLGAAFAGGLVTVVGLLTLAAGGLRRLAATLHRSRLPLVLRQGAASLGRPGGDVLAAIVALGLGILVVVHTMLVERHLTGALQADLPTGAPSTFLIDIQPDQWPGLRDLLAAEGAGDIDSVPVVMARLSSVAGRPVEELAAAAEPGTDREWALTREQRLTYLDAPPEDNTLVAGSWWKDDEVAEASVEEEFAAELGVGVGDALVFDVQGVEVPVTVTSLRAVDWRTFRINFFVVVEPAALEAAPQNRIAAADLPPDRREAIQGRINERFPNVTLIDVRELLDRVTGILRRLSLGVRFLGAFTAAAGLAILFGAVAAASARRGRELALQKTLGFTRRDLVGVLATEHLLVGVVAGTLGTLGALGLTAFVVTRRMDLEWQLFPATVGGAFAVSVLLAAAAGLAASVGALRRPPIEVLRGERG